MLASYLCWLSMTRVPVSTRLCCRSVVCVRAGETGGTSRWSLVNFPAAHRGLNRGHVFTTPISACGHVLSLSCGSGGSNSTMKQWLYDLKRDDWEPLQTRPAWRNPCFFTSLLTSLSVQQAITRGHWPVFGVGPAFVLLSSLLYWYKPRRQCWRRNFDLIVVRAGMSSHVLLAVVFCQPLGIFGLLAGYVAGGVCYAIGRVLTVQRRWLHGAFVHSGVHIFANVGNLLMLRFIR
mmetsp:Transcript_7495/g.12728  ORF Transcript_7495/g.12728 Transcript_7495/m.12728 type:complete len:234 (+) Transcript_7495:160-861(+)